MAIHIGLKEFTATLSDALACSLVNAQKPAMPAAYRPVSTTCMSHREARRTYAGVRFDMRMKGIFALCAVLELCSRSCGICRNPGTRPSLPHPPAAEQQSAGVLPSPNSLSTASTPPACKKAKSVTHVSGTKCHLCLGPLN